MELGKHISLSGRLSSLPKVANEINGKKLVRFTFATLNYCLKNGKYMQHTQWFTVNALGKIAEMLIEAKIKLQTEIQITGKWLVDESCDSDNNKIYSYEILAESITIRNTKSVINRA